jgi:hypothetical protein
MLYKWTAAESRRSCTQREVSGGGEGRREEGIHKGESGKEEEIRKSLYDPKRWQRRKGRHILAALSGSLWRPSTFQQFLSQFPPT